jgi:hypothetical protein
MMYRPDFSLYNGQLKVYVLYCRGNDSMELNGQNFIALATGTEPAAPLSWQYTTQTQEELDESQRQCKHTYDWENEGHR